MYRLCLTSAVLFVMGAAASHAQEISATPDDGTATIDAAPIALDSAAPAALDSSSTADADSSPVAETDETPAPATATKRSRKRTTPAPIKTVEIRDTGERTICEDVNLPGSRMIVQKRCYTHNVYDRSEAKLAEQRNEQTKLAIKEVRRMQDNLDRMEREREWARERAVAAMAAGMH